MQNKHTKLLRFDDTRPIQAIPWMKNIYLVPCSLTWESGTQDQPYENHLHIFPLMQYIWEYLMGILGQKEKFQLPLESRDNIPWPSVLGDQYPWLSNMTCSLCKWGRKQVQDKMIEKVIFQLQRTELVFYQACYKSLLPDSCQLISFTRRQTICAPTKSKHVLLKT